MSDAALGIFLIAFCALPTVIALLSGKWRYPMQLIPVVGLNLLMFLSPFSYPLALLFSLCPTNEPVVFPETVSIGGPYVDDFDYNSHPYPLYFIDHSEHDQIIDKLRGNKNANV